MGVIIALLILSAALIVVGCHAYDASYGGGAQTASWLLAAAGIVGVVAFSISLFLWIGASRESEFYNKEFGTSYTTSEFYWNSGVIRDKSLPASWKRLDINANIASDPSK